MATISIAGCGWLGLPLGERLVADGHTVKGATTTKEKIPRLAQAGIAPYRFTVTKTGIEGTTGDFFSCDTLFINIPPRRTAEITSLYPAQVALLLDRTPATTNVVFASSTSVYPTTNGVVTESLTHPPEKASGRALLAAEQRVQERFPNATIIRFAGLIGPDRHPGRFLAGKTGLSGGGAPVNLIHRDDCIAIVRQIMAAGPWGTVLNACADEHPSKASYYARAAQEMGLDPPQFADRDARDFKQVSNEKLKKLLNYTFLRRID